MFRNIIGSLLALIGAALAVWSPFRVWYGGRHGSDIRVDDLFTGVGVTPATAALLGSLFLPLGFAALLALLGVLLRSRLAVGAAGLLVLGITVLWMVRQGQSAGSLTAGGDGLDVGVAAAVGGGALLLLGAAVMPGRTMRHYGEPSAPYEQPYQPPNEPYEPSAAQPGTRSDAQSDAGSDAQSDPQPYADASAPASAPPAGPVTREPPSAPAEPGHRPEDDTLSLPPPPDHPPG